MSLPISIAVAELFPWTRKQLETALAPLGRSVTWTNGAAAITEPGYGSSSLILLDPIADGELWQSLQQKLLPTPNSPPVVAVIPREQANQSAALLAAGANDVLFADELELLPRVVERILVQRTRLKPWVAEACDREFRDTLWCQGLKSAGVSLWIWNCREG